MEGVEGSYSLGEKPEGNHGRDQGEMDSVVGWSFKGSSTVVTGSFGEYVGQ